MKRLLVSVTVCAASFAALAQEDIPLNGKWSFWLPDDSATANLPLALREETTVEVPHTYNIMDGLEDYAGKAFYERSIPLPSQMRGKKARVNFEAVYHDAVVYVNGKKVGEHIGKGYTPFSFDVTPFLKPGQENRLRVVADNSYTDYNFPFQRAFDWANDGGIYRNVSLHLTGQRSIRYAHFTPSLSTNDSLGRTHLSIRLYEEKVRNATFHFTLREKPTGRAIAEKRLTLKRSAAGTFDTDIDCGKVLPWHFDSPTLYAFEVSVLDGNEVSDTRRGQIGFRDFHVEGNRFVLNGEQVRLPGIESMPGSNPDYGMAEPRHYVLDNARLLKELNATITRFHWVQGDDMLSALDSLGIMVQEELSWWQQPYKELTAEQESLARETLAEMIEAHYNHPCIFSWAMSNEVGDNHSQVRSLGEHIKELDPSRLAVTVGNNFHNYLDNEPSLLLDLPTWNEYVGTWSGSQPRTREELPELLKKIGHALGSRPLLITECGLCEPAFVGGDRRRIDDMLYHIHEWEKTDFTAGYIYFCLEDYRTQMGEEGLGKHRIRRHGITDCRHQPKASFHVLRDLMCPVDVDKVKPSAELGGNTLNVGIRVKDKLPSYTLRGYTISYTDSNGHTSSVALPTMEPGKRYDVLLPNINSQYKFNIHRPTGHVCLNY